MSDNEIALQIVEDLSECVDELIDLSYEELEELGAYEDFQEPKRSYTSDYLTPSRDPRDSAIKNGSASQRERTDRILFDELRKEAANLKFTKQRASGYADVRSSGDWVEDETELNVDQELINKTKNVNPSLFGYDEENEEEDEAFEAAARALQEAQDGGEIRQIVSDLMEEYPRLAGLLNTQTDHPVFRLGKLYSETMNGNRLKRTNGSTKSWQERFGK